MNIQALKSKLDIFDIAQELGLKIDKTGKALCPFHNDKNPSLQFSKEKQICTCFSSNCNAGTMDVVELVKKYKYLELPEALEWLQERAGVVTQEKLTPKQSEKINYSQDFEQMKSSFVASSTARKYAESRVLDWKKLEIGYNAFKSSKFNYLRGCITFPLKNEKGQVVSLYGRSVRNNDKAKHYYTKNRSGLYPGYPSRATKKLILTESVIDTATLLNIKEIADNYTLLALYGTNGLTTEHIQALQRIEKLEEIILFFDGDQSGKEANEKHGKYLKSLFTETKIRIVKTPDETDINELVQSHQKEIFTNLINTAESFFFSEETEEVKPKQEKSTEKEKLPESQNNYKLDTSHKYNLKYNTDTARYEIKGGIAKNGMDRLVISLHIINPETRKKSRVRLDLYEDKQVEKTAREASEKLELRSDLLEQDLNYLADLLDEYREEQQEKEQSQNDALSGAEGYHVIPEDEKKEAIKLLTSKGNLIQNINKLIGKSGVIGEQGNRVFLFCIAASHKFGHTLHALVQGSSGSGKTHLVRQITDFMPLENVIRLTRVTESSFYNYGEYDLQNKLVVIEDYDGLKEEAELAFRELQSNDELRSSVSAKDTEYGSYRTQIRVVKGPISSMAATTKGAIYEDNLSRCFVIAVDESAQQTAEIIDYQNKVAAGEIENSNQNEIQTLLQNSIRLLKPMEVINPFASKIKLPQEAFKIRRLNSNFQSFVKQITLINQYKRKKDKQGRLITAKEDLQTAIEIMFDSIILKVDELDGSLRLFYEDLKNYIQARGKEYEFTQREIRQALRISKTQMHRFMRDLLEMEYLQQSGGYANRGFKYKISYWDDIEKLRSRIKEHLNDQLKNL